MNRLVTTLSVFGAATALLTMGMVVAVVVVPVVVGIAVGFCLKVIWFTKETRQ